MPDDRNPALPAALVAWGAGANICSMLEEGELALARAELHVIEARGRVSDQSAKILVSKASVKAHWRLNKS
jgi:hypothetical protein